ncbi:hypothetical protein CRE_17974 [Caenorhabditis remanei]|uniref:F-box associated domain-containing protein n=1 Tax=Caenorhabditis remanei TaxID=31234 RepID=E3MDT9_CAERE|nr:hypothetical protein CRE_17974 [Caenorhabditis remanei]
MTSKLSYPGLRSVLERLEPVKRIHITSRSSTIQRFDKSIPIHFQNIHFDANGLTLNNVSIHHTMNEISFLWNYITICKQNAFDEIQKENIPEYYLGGRSNIYVDQLRFRGVSSDLALPMGARLITNEVVTRCWCFDKILTIIDPDCFPLKRLTLKVRNPNIFEHPVVISTENLTIEVSTSVNTRRSIDYRKLRNKNVIVERGVLLTNLFVNLINNWKESEKEIGTKYVFNGPQNSSNIDRLLSELGRRFNEFLCSGIIFGPPRFSIPINKTSAIKIYVIDAHGSTINKSLVLEVAAAERSNPCYYRGIHSRFNF